MTPADRKIYVVPRALMIRPLGNHRHHHLWPIRRLVRRLVIRSFEQSMDWARYRFRIFRLLHSRITPLLELGVTILDRRGRGLLIRRHLAGT
jgi:hypothetical protein